MDSFNSIELNALCNQVSSIVVEASTLVSQSNIVVERKGQGNFVSSVDINIEKFLKNRLASLIIGSGFISEESCPKNGRYYNWIIDPIDGTLNFLNGFPFAISVALEFVPQHSILLGVIYNPVEDVLYSATKGGGSTVAVYKSKAEKISVKQFSENEGISIFGIPYNRTKVHRILELAEKYSKISSDLKRIGPASLDICRVAAGQAKLYFELDLNIWDIAAGILILEEAGGHYAVEDDLYLFYGNLVLPS